MLPLTWPLTCSLSSFLYAPLATRQLQVWWLFAACSFHVLPLPALQRVSPWDAPKLGFLGLVALWMDQTKVGGGWWGHQGLRWALSGPWKSGSSSVWNRAAPRMDSWPKTGDMRLKVNNKDAHRGNHRAAPTLRVELSHDHLNEWFSRCMD